jgi:hypothetical protein
MRSSIPSCFKPILTVTRWSDGAGPTGSHPFGTPSTHACFTLKSSQRLCSGLHNVAPTRSDNTRTFFSIGGYRRRRCVRSRATGGRGEWREEGLSTLNAPAARLVYERQIGSATGGNPSPFPDVSETFPSLHHFISPSTQPTPLNSPSRKTSQKKPGLASLMPSRRASQGSRQFLSSGSPPFGANPCAELKIPFKENAG